jgi:hypothetical protein
MGRYREGLIGWQCGQYLMLAIGIVLPQQVRGLGDSEFAHLCDQRRAFVSEPHQSNSPGKTGKYMGPAHGRALPQAVKIVLKEQPTIVTAHTAAKPERVAGMTLRLRRA